MENNKDIIHTSNKGYELVKFSDHGFELEVNVSPSEDTVWLDINQLALLFDVQVPAIIKHISNILSSEELDNSTISILEKVQIEGNRKVTRKTKIYNLDMIIAVGYRVNSKRGTIFRQWANRILKDYMLKGYVINSSRVLVTPENYLTLVNVVNRIDSNQAMLTDRVAKLEERHPKINNMLFFKGQMWDATSLIEDIIGKATKSIILIDGYVDKKNLDLFSKKKRNVTIELYTSKNGNKLTQKEVTDFNNQYGGLNVKYTKEFHDRFLILDKTELYHIGASIKDAGAKAFELSIIEDDKQLKEILKRLIGS